MPSAWQSAAFVKMVPPMDTSGHDISHSAICTLALHPTYTTIVVSAVPQASTIAAGPCRIRPSHTSQTVAVAFDSLWPLPPGLRSAECLATVSASGTSVMATGRVLWPQTHCCSTNERTQREREARRPFSPFHGSLSPSCRRIRGDTRQVTRGSFLGGFFGKAASLAPTSDSSKPKKGVHLACGGVCALAIVSLWLPSVLQLSSGLPCNAGARVQACGTWQHTGLPGGLPQELSPLAVFHALW